MINCTNCGEEIDTEWVSECPLCDYELDDVDLHEEEGLILSIGNDGKAEIKKPSDYIELEKKDFKIIKEFIEGDGKEAFNLFLKNKGAEKN